MTLQKIFFTSKFSCLLSFATPTRKLKLGQQIRRGTILIAKPPGPIIIYDGPIRNTEQQSDHIDYSLFCRCTTVLSLLPATVYRAMTELKSFYCMWWAKGSHTTEHHWRFSYSCCGYFFMVGFVFPCNKWIFVQYFLSFSTNTISVFQVHNPKAHKWMGKHTWQQ